MRRDGVEGVYVYFVCCITLLSMTTIKYLKQLIYKEKVLVCLMYLEAPVQDGPLVGLPDGNDGEHMTEQTAHILSQKKKQQKRKRLWSYNPFQGHGLNDLKNSPLLKVPLPLNSTTLGTTTLAHGPLGNIQEPNYSICFMI
jgi:hypothetical protein